jgi:hypothetical protein
MLVYHVFVLCWVRISAGTQSILTVFSHGFLQSVQIHSGTVSQLNYERFLPRPFEFIINLPLYHPTVCNLRYSVVK